MDLILLLVMAFGAGFVAGCYVTCWIATSDKREAARKE